MKDQRVTPQAKRVAHIHYAASFIGGFIGLIPLIGISKSYGSAQTVNLMEAVIAAFEMKWSLVAYLLGGALLYATGAGLETVLAEKTKLNLKIVSLAVDLAAVTLLFFLPDTLPLTVYLYPTFFAMAFQYCAFSGAYGYGSATIFSTNNFRQTVTALCEAFINGKSEFRLKACFFGACLISFYCGVVTSCLCYFFADKAGHFAVIVPVIILATLEIRRIRIDEAA